MSGTAMLSSWKVPSSGSGAPLIRQRSKGREALSRQPHAQVLELGVVEDAVLGALPSGARFLDAAKRGDLGGDEPGVQADDAVLECLRDSPGTGEVTRVEIRRESKLGVIGHADRIGLGREAEQRGDWTEGFLAR